MCMGNITRIKSKIFLGWLSYDFKIVLNKTVETINFVETDPRATLQRLTEEQKRERRVRLTTMPSFSNGSGYEKNYEFNGLRT